MFTLITRHSKIFFEKICLSNIKHDVITSKLPFLSLLHWECMSKYFLENFFHVCMAYTSTDKSAF